MKALGVICVRCQFGNAAKHCVGPCPCLADPERRDILVHIANTKAGRPSCPLHKHDNIDPGAPDPPPPPPPQPIPREQWRADVHALARYARPEDAGLGDGCKRILNDPDASMNSTAAVVRFLSAEYGAFNIAVDGLAWKKTGNECGNCETRRNECNVRYRFR